MVNLSYGEAVHRPNHGRLVELAEALVRDHGEIDTSEGRSRGEGRRRQESQRCDLRCRRPRRCTFYFVVVVGISLFGPKSAQREHSLGLPESPFCLDPFPALLCFLKWLGQAWCSCRPRETPAQGSAPSPPRGPRAPLSLALGLTHRRPPRQPKRPWRLPRLRCHFRPLHFFRSPRRQRWRRLPPCPLRRRAVAAAAAAAVGGWRRVRTLSRPVARARTATWALASRPPAPLSLRCPAGAPPPPPRFNCLSLSLDCRLARGHCGSCLRLSVYASPTAATTATYVFRWPRFHPRFAFAAGSVAFGC